MDEMPRRAMKRSESDPLEAWLNRALAPAPGGPERAISAALGAGRESPRRLLPLAAAALLAVALGGALLLLRPAPGPAPAPGSPGPPVALITNASGVTELVRPAALGAPFPLRFRSGGGCTTVLFNRGDVLAVYESCGPTAVRIEGGAS